MIDHMFNRSYVQDHQGHPHYFSDQQIQALTHQFGGEHNTHLLQILKNLSDPTKFAIYQLLGSVAEMAVTDIALVLGLSNSAVSHALSDLKKLEIVECRPCGQLRCYALTQSTPQTSILASIIQRFSSKRRSN